MDVLRLSIWVVRGRICFIRKRVFGIIDGVMCGCELSRFESSRVWGPVAPGFVCVASLRYTPSYVPDGIRMQSQLRTVVM